VTTWMVVEEEEKAEEKKSIVIFTDSQNMSVVIDKYLPTNFDPEEVSVDFGHQ